MQHINIAQIFLKNTFKYLKKKLDKRDHEQLQHTSSESLGKDTFGVTQLK